CLQKPPRERAIARVLVAIRPNWRDLSIHESSPGGGAFSQKLRRLCRGYVPTQFDPSLPFGVLDPTGRWRNENLEAQTFPDASFDIVIAQDVFEHLFHPGRAAKEIARTLKPDGVALLTVPVVRHFGRTQRRARLTPCGIQHILPEQYHGNPVGDGRSLVTIDWSYDIGAYLTAHSGIPWVVMVIDDMSMGIRDPYNTILIGWKAQIPDLEE
ncbi:MAG: class I SAM-dependent methyltransferase, partial [Rhodovarius sp.]|nr:class I SAM-dependent methyltransferase [Rhodovarius sp.]